MLAETQNASISVPSLLLSKCHTIEYLWVAYLRTMSSPRALSAATKEYVAVFQGSSPVRHVYSTAPGHNAVSRVTTNASKSQIRFLFLSRSMIVRLFHEGNRRCGPSLGRSGQDLVQITRWSGCGNIKLYPLPTASVRHFGIKSSERTRYWSALSKLY